MIPKPLSFFSLPYPYLGGFCFAARAVGGKCAVRLGGLPMSASETRSSRPPLRPLGKATLSEEIAIDC